MASQLKSKLENDSTEIALQASLKDSHLERSRRKFFEKSGFEPTTSQKSLRKLRGRSSRVVEVTAIERVNHEIPGSSQSLK